MTAARSTPAVDLDGRTALVTGAASGIGEAVAVALAGAGAKVHAVDRDAAGLERLGAVAGVQPHVVDLSDLDALGGLPTDVDVLVNNAGTFPTGGPMIFTQYYLDCLSQASYLVADETTGQAVVSTPAATSRRTSRTPAPAG